jgi:two-component system phosphate regulon response regulator PhoB
MAKKILVIDDDKDVRDTIVYVLENEGYEAIASEDAEILKTINTVDPGLVIMDNYLTEWKSDANGQQLTKNLKLNRATKHIPVVLISAASNIDEIAKTGLADAFLKKPFDADSLVKIVMQFIK